MATIIEPEPERPPRRQRSLPVRIIRFPLKILLLALVGFFMGVRRHPRISTLVVLMLVAAGGAVYYFAPPSLPVRAPGAAAPATLSSAQGALPPPQTPVQYFHAQETGDAATMWGLLSDSVKQGGTVQQLQTKLDQIKPSLGVTQQITYVGGVREIDGNAVYLYLLTVNQGGQTNQVTYLFTLDQQGKIVKIE